MSADLTKYKMITVDEVARLLGNVSTDTILRLGRRGDLPILRISDGRRAVRLADIEAYQDRQLAAWHAEVELNKRLAEAGRTTKRKRGRPRKVLFAETAA
ncbi:hypothetical protein CU669_19895 [Paramagnetospirillum kuznetsovii]|uniref:Helix-turn-helix domain-containing protein n=1 Tax=Paramagnetospirillum kuznetsovii TaxID=2053833 RepID=A0A364NSW0_9PROT|nr:helix-turn-helix domain-containing protein [Paramagnetospirillum kuznetsovii]RAU20154.1 hypothetical protein CU669_19895 [Paramagnetospirillum kuznetsovii]